MLRLQDMPPDWVEKHTIKFEEALLGSYTEQYVAVSHRWESATKPDKVGAQLVALRSFVREQRQIKYIFYDEMSLPQGEDKTPAEKAEFGQQLPNINLLYLGCSVLILLDRSYSSRFWTLYEAWLSFMMATKHGLVPTMPQERLRCHIRCLHGTLPETEAALRKEWCYADAEKAYAQLSRPDITVTNLSDKELQLPKILSMNERVKELMASREDTGSALTPPRPTVATTPPSTVPHSTVPHSTVPLSTVPLSDAELRIVAAIEHRILGEVGQRVVVALDKRGQASRRVVEGCHAPCPPHTTSPRDSGSSPPSTATGRSTRETSSGRRS